MKAMRSGEQDHDAIHRESMPPETARQSPIGIMRQGKGVQFPRYRLPCMTQPSQYINEMLGRLYEDQDCSAARALEVVGERWSLLILRDAIFRGFTRFSQFEETLQISTNILAK